MEPQLTRTLAAVAFLRHPAFPIVLELVEARLRIWAAAAIYPVPAAATVSAAAPKPLDVTVCAAAARSMTTAGFAKVMGLLAASLLMGKLKLLGTLLHAVKSRA